MEQLAKQPRSDVLKIQSLGKEKFPGGFAIFQAQFFLQHWNHGLNAMSDLLGEKETLAAYDKDV